MPFKTLITGGAGFIGSHLTSYLVGLGYEVSILDNFVSGNKDTISYVSELSNHGKVKIFEGDCRNTRLISELIHEADIVVHLAARLGVCYVMQNSLDTITNNIDSSHSVLDAAARYGKKVLIASSSEVYGKLPRNKLSENDDSLLGPVNKSRWSYAASKIIDEHIAWDYFQKGLDIIVMRFFNITGTRQSHRFGMVVPRFIDAALNGLPLSIYGDGSQSRTFCDVRDCIRAVERLMNIENPAFNTFNIGSDRSITISSLAEKVLEISGKSGKINYLSEKELPGEFEEIAFRCPDLSRIKEATGWMPEYSLEETISSMINTYKNNGIANECLYS